MNADRQLRRGAKLVGRKSALRSLARETVRGSVQTAEIFAVRIVSAARPILPMRNQFLSIPPIADFICLVIPDPWGKLLPGFQEEK